MKPEIEARLIAEAAAQGLSSINSGRMGSYIIQLNPLTMLKLYIHKGEDYEQSICS